MIQYTSLIVTVDELWLKGANKHLFTTALRKNVRRALKHLKVEDFEYITEGPKHILRCKGGFKRSTIEGLQKVTGISHITPVVEIKKDLQEAQEKAVELISGFVDNKNTFKVLTKRSSKSFPYDSMETSKAIGSAILKKYPHLKVNLKKPELEVRVSILKDHIYLSHEVFSGFGGLPVSTAGNMVTLLSGGIDSPVAAFLMAKRGVEQSFLFFHAYPFVGNEVVDKICRLHEKVKPFMRYGPLNIVPFGEIQQKIAEICPEGYQTLFFRIYMLKTAKIFARHVGHQGIITGDALSQVASQTLYNIGCVDQCLADTTLLRPLIGMNKAEIQDFAKNIGTYETSIEPHDDACALLAPQTPVTKGDAQVCLKFLKENPLDDLICQALNKTQRMVKNNNGERVPFASFEKIDFKTYLD